MDKLQDLQIEKTKYTFAVDFRTDGKLRLEGSSYPENASSFFEPIKEWLQELLGQAGVDVSLAVRIEYLNTSSSKYMLDLFRILDGHFNGGNKVSVEWHYEADDEDIKEAGEEFNDGLAINIEMVTV